MQKLIFTIGISGSGKTTFAKQHCKNYPEFIRINRDDLRSTLFGYTLQEYFSYFKDMQKEEHLITKLTLDMIIRAFKMGKSVILDNTHLKLSYITDVIKKIDYSDYEIELVDFVLDVNECIRRDSFRPVVVGKDVILRQYDQFNQIDFVEWNKKVQEFKKSLTFTPVVQDTSLPNAIIFDIDGTLALHNNRSPYDYSKVSTDILNQAVYDLYDNININNYDPFGDIGRYTKKELRTNIIICTGREGSTQCKLDTLKWLDKNNIEFDEYYQRVEGDSKKGNIVFCTNKMNTIKQNLTLEELEIWIPIMYKKLKNNKLGLTCFQVNDGDF